MTTWTEHLIIMPILLPLAAGALMLLFSERRYALKRVISLATTLALIALATWLVRDAASAPEPQIYLLGNWPAPFGITLVSDRLSAVMLLLANILGFASLTYASAGWDRAGPRFHALFMLQLVGLNGAFLTGDLFNLFVFFEVLLAASYGLLLHGARRERVSAGLHYISINVAASLLFLIGASLIYSVTGTLNLADLAVRISAILPENLALFQAGVSVLMVAFLIKAGIWPLGFWLPSTYAAAAPPVAALFAILSKVGIYAILRMSALMPENSLGAATPFASDWFQIGGTATIAFATIGILSSRSLARLAGFSLMISSGTLIATIGFSEAVRAAALLYLVSSTLAISAFYLLIELIARGDAQTAPMAPDAVFDDEDPSRVEENGQTEIGVVIPASWAVVGGVFMFFALLLAGLPPLSGFVAKFAIIDGLLRPQATPATWTLIGMIMISGLAVVIAASRAGVDLIWTPDRPPAPLRLAEAMPIGLLLTLSVALTIFAGPAMAYAEQASRALSHGHLMFETAPPMQRLKMAP